MKSKVKLRMCGLLFEYDVRLSVKLYFAKSLMNIRTKEKVGNIALPTLFLYETKLGQDLKATVKKQSGGLFLGRALMII